MEGRQTVTSRLPPLTSDRPNIEVGRYSYGSPRLLTWTDDDRITIGSFCSIADDVTIMGGGEHRSEWITTYPLRIAFGLPRASHDGHPATKGETRIGNDVWIGYGATILSGVTVKDGAVVGAGTVVSNDVDPYTVVIGNPARVLRHRFDKDTIEALLKIRWWDWPIEKIVANVDILCSSNVGALRQRS